MISVFFSMLVGKFGLGLVTAGGLLAGWYFIPEVPWLTDKLRRLMLFVGVIIGSLTIGYGYGGIEVTARYQAKLAKQMTKAINEGRSAEADALKKFDESKETPDDGFARD